MKWNIGDIRKVFVELKSKLGLYHVVLPTIQNAYKDITMTHSGDSADAKIEKKMIPKTKCLD